MRHSPPPASSRPPGTVTAVADLTDAQLDDLIDAIGLKRPRGGRPRAECGTVSAYSRHCRKGEPIDEACRRANREAKRGQYAAAIPGNRKPIAHGEFRGARQHRYRGEELCEACHKAEADYQRERAAKSGSPRKAGKPKPQVYLTEAEWQARRAARQSGGAQ